MSGKFSPFSGRKRAPESLPVSISSRKPPWASADDRAEQFAVVDGDLVADGDAVEDLRQGAGRLERHVGDLGAQLAGEQDRVADPQAVAVRRCEHLAGPHLGTADIHEDGQAAPDRRFRGMDVGDHAAPFRHAVVGAVDAKGVGAGLGQAADDGRFGRGIGGERHHDAADAAAMGRAEAFGGVAGKTDLAAEELALTGRVRHGLAGKRGHRHDDGIERGQDAAFEDAERRDAEHHQLALERAQVAVTDGQIVGEIEGARREDAAPDAAAPAQEQRAAFRRHGSAQRGDLGEHASRASADVVICCHAGTIHGFLHRAG